MEEIVVSKNGVPIRLPEERWIHIVENHEDLAGYMDEVLGAVENPDSYLLRFPYRKMWIDYDKEADVLYINFKRPQQATDSEMTKDGILLRYRGDELVGMTILDASQRGGIEG